MIKFNQVLSLWFSTVFLYFAVSSYSFILYNVCGVKLEISTFNLTEMMVIVFIPDTVFLILYKELCYRHIYNKLKVMHAFANNLVNVYEVPITRSSCSQPTVLNVFTLIETICPNIYSKSRLKSAESPFLGGLHRSRTSLLKLPIQDYLTHLPLDCL